MYAILSAGLFRSGAYTTTRLAVWTALYEWRSFSGGLHGEHPGLLTKTAIGMVSGLAGAFATTPVDVALVRMTTKSDPRYTNIITTIHRIRKDEGLRGLWRGAVPTVVRAMIATVGK